MYLPNGSLSFVEHLRTEHRHLNQALRHVDGLFRDAQSCKILIPKDRLVRTLTELRTELSNHFQGEEEGGCMEEAISRCPAVSHEADRVESEHPILLAYLDGIITAARISRSAPTAIDSLKCQFEKFAEQLKQHEATEDHIMQFAFGIPSENGD